MARRRAVTALVVSLLLLLTACSGGDVPTVAAAPRLVAPAEAVALIGQVETVVLDVRTPAEFADGHVEGAQNLDLTGSAFRDQLSRLDPQARYVVYCRTGSRSAAAVQVMQELGFDDVADAGGYDDLVAAGAPSA